MNFIDYGSGNPIVFIHGNPTSSYLWRNIIPQITGRSIAVDLIGMGNSSKPDIEYSFDDHYSFLEEFLTNLNLDPFTLVIHDWGATLGFHYAMNHPTKVKSIIFMEPVLFPMTSFDDLKGDVGEFLKNVRNPDIGYQMIIKQNIFIEKMLPAMIKRPLDEEILNMYRKPYMEEKDRTPLLKWPLEIPIAGKPKSTHKILENIVESLQNSVLADIPKLLLHVNPGGMMPKELVDYCKQIFLNLDTVYLGEGLHFIQEDLPNEIAKEISIWIENHKRVE